MTNEERMEERNFERVRKRMLHGFILEEADESDNDDSVQTEEDGDRDAYVNLLPLYSIGQPYIDIIPGRKRLMRIISVEFRDLTNQEQIDVVRKTKIHNEMHNERSDF